MTSNTISRFLSGIPFGVYLVLIWGISILLVNPLGDFPLNDDWAYAKSVWALCEQGKLTMEDWPAMTLVGQVFLGALFCKLFGLSHSVLRVSTLVAGLIGAFTFYKLALYLSNNRKLAAFASLLLFFNPLYFSLSFTFMTDVHFMTGMLLSLYFFLQYHKEARVKHLILATIFSVITTMIRQPGIIVPLVFSLTAFVGSRNRSASLKYFIPFMITVLSLIIHSFWLKHFASDVYSVGKVSDLWMFIKKQNFQHWKVRISQSLLYAGLFSLPLSSLLWITIKHQFKKSSWVFLAACILFVGIILTKSSYPCGNILYNLGMGPKVLKDTYVFQNIHPQFIGETWTIMLRILSAFGILLMLFLIWKKGFFKKISAHQPVQYIRLAKLNLLLFSVVYGIFLVIVSSYFDRYSVPLFATLCLLIIPYRVKISKPAALVAILMVLLFAFFSISATHDYLSWNRSRWTALNYLINERGVSASDIDGGFEFNAWVKTRNTIYGNPGTSWWFVYNDDYVIAFGDFAGFRKFKGFYYPQILSGKKDSIYILQKDKILK